MTVWSDELLSDLEMLTPGLTKHEPGFDQLDCFVFLNGEVGTFNREVMCRKKTGLQITGALNASALLASLRSLGRKKLRVTEENRVVERQIGRNKTGTVMERAVMFERGTSDQNLIRFGLFKQDGGKIHLPFDRMEKPKEWLPFPAEIWEAVEIGQFCVGQSTFCFGFVESWMLARDGHHAMRFKVGKVFDVPVALPGRDMGKLAGLGLREFSHVGKWVHFRNRSGLVVSCINYQPRPGEQPYFEIFRNNGIWKNMGWWKPKGKPDDLFKHKGYLLRFSEKCRKECELAALVAKENLLSPDVKVSVTDGRIVFRASNLDTRYEGTAKVYYKGPAVTFAIKAEILEWIITQQGEALISTHPLLIKVVRPDWEYVGKIRPTPKRLSRPPTV